MIVEAQEAWDEGDKPNVFLRGLVEYALINGLNSDINERASKGYFDWFAQLRKGTDKWTGLSQIQARRLLSRLPLISHLLINEHMSCTQIARLLGSLESSLDLPFQAIGVLARGIGHLPTLDPSSVITDLWIADEARSAALFPDSDSIESFEIAGREATKFVPAVEVAGLLATLGQFDSPRAGDYFWPYLQILHFCLIPIEYFDHPASYLYEFNPRGRIANQLFAKYPADTGNPFLNNAKAVESFDRGWARNRGADDAHALVALLELLDSLPVTARGQLAAILRAWLHRVLELQTTEPTPLPVGIGLDAFRTALAFIEQSDTQTHGAIEQRIVDSLAMLCFGGDGWRPRGLGESVNASNFARHKLGDVEFANLTARSAIALEAHGGHLSVAYVRDHQRSLSRIVAQRLAESWAALDDPDHWRIQVIFVAHSKDASGLPEVDNLHGVPVSYEYWNYQELVDAALRQTPNQEAQLSAFRQWVVDPLNATTTRQSVRARFMDIAGILEIGNT